MSPQSNFTDDGELADAPPPRQPAQQYRIGRDTIVCIEHPCIVQDVAKAIDSLGGQSAVADLVRPERARNEAQLFLRPDDPLAAGIVSGNVTSDDLLIEIKVPKIIGRKRKRAVSNDLSIQVDTQPQQQSGNLVASPTNGARDLKRLQKTMSDNLSRYRISVLGHVDHIHRFRGMPDFVYSTSGQSFMTHFRDTIVPMKYESAKRFRFSESKGVKQATELIPPPQFSHLTMPFNYSYHQNPAVRHMLDESGQVVVQNDQMARKIWTERLTHDQENIPTGPAKNVPSLEILDDPTKKILKYLGQLMDQRPIWTRRALTNAVRAQGFNDLGKNLYQYVGYTFRSGPWREAIIKYGVDPRTDPKYRVYQTIMYQFDDEGRPIKGAQKGPRGGMRVMGKKQSKPDAGLGVRSHIFDGKRVGMDGKLWQVCDITDPLLESILATQNLRRRCHTSTDGWYQNVTWAKARILAKTKMVALITGDTEAKDTNYARIMSLPDVADSPHSITAYLLGSNATPQELDMAATMRAMMSGSEQVVTGEDALQGSETQAQAHHQDSSISAAINGQGYGNDSSSYSEEDDGYSSGVTDMNGYTE